MKIPVRIWTVAFSIAMLAGAAMADETPGKGGPDLTPWRMRARIEPTGEPEKGLIEFPVPPEVFDGARKDLADLRILAAGRPVAWIARRPRGTRRDVPLEARVYNPTHIPGKLNRVVVDFGESTIKHQIKVITPGRNFKRQTLVEAGMDGEHWEVLKDGEFLFDISPESGRSYRKDRISLPQNDFRFLRITVYHDPDDMEEVPVTGVRAWRREGEPAPLEPVVIVDSEVQLEQGNNITLITLDLAHRNLPLRRLYLDFEDRNFHRYITLWGRDKKTRRRVQSLEGGGKREMVVEEPWTRISSGNIHRYTSGAGTDEALSLTADNARYRYLQVRIHNGDNPPLTFISAGADRYITYVAFPAGGEAPHWVYFGNPDAEMPDYDLRHYAGRLRSEGLTAASTGSPEALHADIPEDIPFSELYSRVLWIALAGAVAIMFWMVWRQVQNAGASDAA